ncbi:LAGLIDADG family homing endonuclease [Halobacillus litoralis]|uniref:LAGLIDADG family homing endonuclease n=1 Tax=Halobacillus litoralis TaxID=45668 RepID=UPI001CD3E426|nr:LAGLIDADG family homing endonuclease [Halobacillus litoralis]MCA1021492.1 hypothetical protein [Halobacillus litoralis]
MITQRGYIIKSEYVKVLDDNGFIVSEHISKVREDSCIAIPLVGFVPSNEIILSDKYLIRDLNSRSKLYDRPKFIDGDLAELLGLLVADGTLRERGVKLSKRYHEVTMRFKTLIDNCFGYSGGSIKLRPSNDYMYEVSSVDIAQYLMNFEGLLPKNKHVPKEVISSNIHNYKRFLRGVFEDGTVNLKNGKFDHIEMTMKSELMAFQIQQMLLTLGVICTTKKYKRKDLWHIYIYKDYAKSFLKQVGFISKIKQENLEKCSIDSHRSSPRKSIPHIPKLLTSIHKYYHLNTNKSFSNYFNGESHDRRVTKPKLKELIVLNEELLKSIEVYDYLYSVVDDFYFDELAI